VAISGTRATDTDRTNTCQVLDSALAEGQLSMEEHRQRVSAATNAVTLGQLQSLVSDLQIHRAPARLAQSTLPARVWGIAIAVVVAVVLLGALIIWGLFGNTSSPSSPSPPSSPLKTTSVAAPPPSTPAVGATTAPPQVPTSLLSLSGVTQVLAQMRTQFGDTLGYQLNIYQDKAVLQRPDTANAHKIVEWIYRGGSWTNKGPSTGVFSDSAVGDLSKFDVQAVLGVIQSAPQTLHIYDANDTFLSIESTKDGSLYLDIHVSDDSNSGSIHVGADGSVEDISPPAH
jgi:hypothetical protein